MRLLHAAVPLSAALCSCAGVVRRCDLVEVTLSTPPERPAMTQVTVRCDGDLVVVVEGPEVVGAED